MFEKTYQMADGENPAPLSGEQYKAIVETRWEALLSSNPTERAIQNFLEENPVLVPGAFGARGLSSGHDPHPGALISQPKLYGYREKVPDLLWISKNSTQISPVFIELEKPSKKFFTKQGHPTAQFTQARHQLTQWRQWIKIPNNQDRFISDYGLGRFRDLAFEPHYILIYGRRSEYENDATLTRTLGEMMREDETVMSYDRLSYDPKADDLPSVKHTTRGYRLLHVPPTYWLGPAMFPNGAKHLGRADAVKRNAILCAARKDFLLSRLPYWEKWNEGPSGMMNGSDRE